MGRSRSDGPVLGAVSAISSYKSVCLERQLNIRSRIPRKNSLEFGPVLAGIQNF